MSFIDYGGSCESCDSVDSGKSIDSSNSGESGNYGESFESEFPLVDSTPPVTKKIVREKNGGRVKTFGWGENRV